MSSIVGHTLDGQIDRPKNPNPKSTPQQPTTWTNIRDTGKATKDAHKEAGNPKYISQLPKPGTAGGSTGKIGGSINFIKGGMDAARSMRNIVRNVKDTASKIKYNLEKQIEQFRSRGDIIDLNGFRDLYGNDDFVRVGNNIRKVSKELQGLTKEIDGLIQDITGASPNLSQAFESNIIANVHNVFNRYLPANTELNSIKKEFARTHPKEGLFHHNVALKEGNVEYLNYYKNNMGGEYVGSLVGSGQGDAYRKSIYDIISRNIFNRQTNTAGSLVGTLDEDGNFTRTSTSSTKDNDNNELYRYLKDIALDHGDNISDERSFQYLYRSIVKNNTNDPKDNPILKYIYESEYGVIDPVRFDNFSDEQVDSTRFRYTQNSKSMSQFLYMSSMVGENKQSYRTQSEKNKFDHVSSIEDDSRRREMLVRNWVGIENDIPVFDNIILPQDQKEALRYIKQYSETPEEEIEYRYLLHRDGSRFSEDLINKGLIPGELSPPPVKEDLDDLKSYSYYFDNDFDDQ